MSNCAVSRGSGESLGRNVILGEGPDWPKLMRNTDPSEAKVETCLVHPLLETMRSPAQGLDCIKHSKVNLEASGLCDYLEKRDLQR